MKKRILVLGANGNLAKFLIPVLEKDFKIFKTSNKNLHNFFHLKKILKRVNPNLIINLAAKTDLNFCEKNMISAFQSNFGIVQNLAFWQNTNKNSYIVHFSTDNNYDAKSSSEKKIKISNSYGLTKFAGDMILDHKKNLIIRTNFICKPKIKDNFINQTIHSIKKRKKIYLFNDVYFSPLHAKTLSKITLILIKKKIKGIYNLGSVNSISKANLIISLCKKLNLKISNCKICKSKSLKQKIKRSKNMTMNIEKIKKKININFPTINNEIAILAKDYNEKR